MCRFLVDVYVFRSYVRFMNNALTNFTIPQAAKRARRFMVGVQMYLTVNGTKCILHRWKDTYTITTENGEPVAQGAI